MKKNLFCSLMSRKDHILHAFSSKQIEFLLRLVNDRINMDSNHPEILTTEEKQTKVLLNRALNQINEITTNKNYKGL